MIDRDSWLDSTRCLSVTGSGTARPQGAYAKQRPAMLRMSCRCIFRFSFHRPYCSTTGLCVPIANASSKLAMLPKIPNASPFQCGRSESWSLGACATRKSRQPMAVMTFAIATASADQLPARCFSLLFSPPSDLAQLVKGHSEEKTCRRAAFETNGNFPMHLEMYGKRK